MIMLLIYRTYDVGNKKNTPSNNLMTWEAEVKLKKQIFLKEELQKFR